MKTAYRVIAAALLGLLLAGCAAVGPDYEQPEAPVRDDWSSEPAEGLDTC